jgi:hypothetical protein
VSGVCVLPLRVEGGLGQDGYVLDFGLVKQAVDLTLDTFAWHANPLFGSETGTRRSLRPREFRSRE